MTKDIELLPCPGCNGHNLVINGYGIERPGETPDDRAHEVVCDDCGWSGPEVAPRASALAAWNRRSTDMESERPAPAAQVGGVSVDEIEAIILATEPDVPASVDGDKIWTKRMATALHARLSTLSAIPTETGKGEDGDVGEWSDGGKSWEPSKVAGAGEGEPVARRGIYVASKVAHAELWRDLRHFELEPIISTWIDEAGVGESASLEDLWRRCVHEASNAGALIIYRRPDEVLKGAWVELGAALASGVPVFAVGIEEFTVANHAGITHCANLVEARQLARAVLSISSKEA